MTLRLRVRVFTIFTLFAVLFRGPPFTFTAGNIQLMLVAEVFLTELINSLTSFTKPTADFLPNKGFTAAHPRAQEVSLPMGGGG